MSRAAWACPVRRLVAATNANDIVFRVLTNGVYRSGAVQPSLSPSMDIQVASNFERALFEAANRDAGWVRAAMADFARDRTISLPPQVVSALGTV